MASSGRSRRPLAGLLLLLTTCLLAATAAAQNLIFHSSVVAAHRHNDNPADDDYQAVNFYYYVSIGKGYVSFGWFLGNAPESVNTTRCAANGTHGYDWYEYSGSPLTCTPGFHRCQTRAVGWQVPGVDGGPAKLIVDHDYEGLRFTLGPGEAETLHASYYNAKGGMLAIGTRRMVTGEECVDAYRTMKRVRKEHAVKLAFELRDPCGGMGKLEEEEELVVEVPGPGPLAEKVRLWGKALAQRLGLGSKDEL